jgi:hypothetical protein
MKNYSIRGLEVHDWSHIWNFRTMRRYMKFMVENDMNTLVLHHVGVLDLITFPAKFLGGGAPTDSIFEVYNQIDQNIYRYALRENLNLYRRDFLKQLIREARQSGIDVYIEDKELWFSDFILNYKPGLMKNGVLCPSDPFWWEEFLPAKYEELFVALPDLAGVVVSFGTGESRLAIANMHACGCDLCRKMTPAQWHTNMILGTYGPFKKRGKQLVVRDFIYTKEEQEQFAEALEVIPQEIVLSLKNTPHDFYPTFPDNPLIGRVGERPQWIEYDVNGQYFGWGVVPSIMFDDIEHRLAYGLDHKVSGFFMRTDWEGVQDVSCFDGPNLLNLYAAAILGKNPAADRRAIVLRWLEGESMLDPASTPMQIHATVDWLLSVLEPTWPIMRGAVYVNGTVFSDNSLFHVSFGQPQWVAETHHSLKNWFADAKDALGLTVGNVQSILGEKERASKIMDEALAALASGRHALTEAAYRDLLDRFELMKAYVEGFRLETRLWVLGRLWAENRLDTLAGLDRPVKICLEETIDQIKEYTASVKNLPQLSSYPACVLLNVERMECFIRDVEKKIKATRPLV